MVVMSTVFAHDTPPFLLVGFGVVLAEITLSTGGPVSYRQVSKVLVLFSTDHV